MNIAGRLRRAETRTKAIRQAALDAWVSAWLQEASNDDVRQMLAFMELLCKEEYEEAEAMLPEDCTWLPNLTRWMEESARIEGRA